MKRRNFLKAIAVIPVIAIAPKSFAKLLPEKELARCSGVDITGEIYSSGNRTIFENCTIIGAGEIYGFDLVNCTISKETKLINCRLIGRTVFLDTGKTNSASFLPDFPEGSTVKNAHFTSMCDVGKISEYQEIPDQVYGSSIVSQMGEIQQKINEQTRLYLSNQVYVN